MPFRSLVLNLERNNPDLFSPGGLRYFQDYSLEPEVSATCIHCEHFQDWVRLDELDSELVGGS
ncbi:MAG: hypothetical protein V3V08_08360 [Nannocystaceae bacterium]